MIRSILSDILFIVGLGSTTYGLYLMYDPALYVFPGVVCMAIGIRSALVSK